MKIFIRFHVRIAICCAMALLTFQVAFAQYTASDYVLTTQEQVDSFSPADLQGRNLVITGTSVTNLTHLSNIQQLPADLIIENSNLISLSGLHNVQTIGGNLRITNNPGVGELGFYALTKVKNLTIENNNNLASIDDTDFPALAGITEESVFGAVLTIQNNPSLQTISGFNALTKTEGIKIDNNASLTSITGFQVLPSVFTNFNGFKASFGFVVLSNNNALTNIDGFLNVTYIERLTIQGNASLKNLHGLANLRSTGGDGLTVSTNAVLEDLDGLARLNSVNITSSGPNAFTLRLDQNPLLTKPCGIHPLINSLGPAYVIPGASVQGSGFTKDQLKACSGTPLSPLIQLKFDDEAGGGLQLSNTGSVPANFLRSANIPTSSTNNAPLAGSTQALDFGSTPGNYYVQSETTIDALKNLSAFTITGWLNARSNTAGSGGNRIVSWINNGGEGVDLVYQSDGSLRLGIDGWPDNSPAFSSPNKVTTDPSVPSANWVFFAVTYQSNGRVQFYFGKYPSDAALDVIKTYTAPGVTGSAINKLAIGAFNDGTRNPGTYDRMFRGLIDEVKIFGYVLTPANIVSVQHGQSTDVTPPSAPGNLEVTAKSSTTVSLSWSPAVDNIQVTGYDLYNGTTLLASIAPVIPYTVTGLTEETNYSFSLKAKDAAGNVSAASNVVPVTTELGAEYVLATQAQVNAFTPAAIRGRNLVIRGADITNLDNLSTIQSLPASLIIENNPSLTSLTALNGIDTIAANLRIANNPGITTLGGFTDLKKVKNLTIENNNNLLAINGFASLEGITEESVYGAVLTIQNNPGLQTISGFNALTKTEGIKIDNNASLTGITGFHILPSVSTEYAHFKGSSGFVMLTNNNALTNIDGFLTVTYIEMLTIQGNATLKNLHGLSNLKRTGGYGLTVSTNAMLEDLDGLANLNSPEISSSGPNAFILRLDQNPLLTKPCGIYPLIRSLLPEYVITGASVQGSGFTIDQLKACGGTSLTPLIQLKFDEAAGGLQLANTGSVPANFFRSANIPATSFNNAPLAGSMGSLDFGSTPGNYYVQSETTIDALKNLSAFTITGWLNARSNTAGSGGNRIVSWINNGGEGVDLVYQSNGSLRLGVDGWPDNSPAFSSPNKITTDASVPSENWVFFAVTYQSNGQVQFYFGKYPSDATLDVTKTYTAPGITGSAINKLAIGAFNDGTRNPGTYDRMFRGLIDEVKIFGSVLTPANIVHAQRGQATDVTPPSTPGNFAVTSTTSTSVSLAWNQAVDNVAVTKYEITGNGVTYTTGNVTSYTVTGLTPNTTYNFTILAKDAAENASPLAGPVTATTNADQTPLVRLSMNEGPNIAPVNAGSLGGTFLRSANTPFSSNLKPEVVGGDYSIGFSTTPGNYYVESSAVLDGLKGLSSFTLTGWINNTSTAAGSGGNRIISWINHGGDGVDLVYQSNGSLRLGVDGWPDSSPAFSSPNKVTTVPSGAESPNNWVFFAVTYQSNGQVQFYFGTDHSDAALDVTRSYVGPGVVGNNISRLAIGNFNIATRNANTYDRMLRGFIDDIQIHGSVLGLADILSIQGRASGGNLARLGMPAPGMAETNSEIKAELYQNYPNPYSADTEIGVSLPHDVNVARITVTDLSGRSLKNVSVEQRGRTSVTINGAELNAGMYFYTLIVDGKVVDMKRMVLTK